MITNKVTKAPKITENGRVWRTPRIYQRDPGLRPLLVFSRGPRIKATRSSTTMSLLTPDFRLGFSTFTVERIFEVSISMRCELLLCSASRTYSDTATRLGCGDLGRRSSPFTSKSLEEHLSRMTGGISVTESCAAISNRAGSGSAKGALDNLAAASRDCS